MAWPCGNPSYSGSHAVGRTVERKDRPMRCPGKLPILRACLSFLRACLLSDKVGISRLSSIQYDRGANDGSAPRHQWKQTSFRFRYSCRMEAGIRGAPGGTQATPALQQPESQQGRSMAYGLLDISYARQPRDRCHASVCFRSRFSPCVLHPRGTAKGRGLGSPALQPIFCRSCFGPASPD